MTEANARRLVSLLAAGFPTVTLGEVSVGLYSQAIAEYDEADARAGIAAVLKTERFWPAIATLRAAIDAELRHRREQAALEAATEPPADPPTPEALAAFEAMRARFLRGASLRQIEGGRA